MSFAETFKALSDPVRREILELLKKGRMSAGEIASHFDMSQATVSYHLSLLKDAGLICEEKDKNFIFYQINASLFALVGYPTFMFKTINLGKFLKFRQ